VTLVLAGHDALLVHAAARSGMLPGSPLLTPVLHHSDACACIRDAASACDCACELRIGDARLRLSDLAPETLLLNPADRLAVEGGKVSP
jgi:hypothetical protein